MGISVLRFQKIEVNNFRPYEHAIIEFSQDPKTPITIIEGRNAAGKTSLVHAITWCLYGEESIEDKDQGNPRCHSRAIESLKTGDTFETSVTITLADEQGPKYEISRIISARRHSDNNELQFDSEAAGNVPAGISFSTSVSYAERKKDGNWDPTTNDAIFTARVDKIIPRNIAEFVIFDGEQLDNFFRVDSVEKIQNGIEKVSGLPILELAIKHLGMMEKQFGRKVAKASGHNAQTLNDKLEIIQNSMKKLSSEITILEKNNSELSENEKQLRIESEKYPLKALEELERHVEDEKHHRVEYEKAVEEFRDNRKSFLQNNFSRILCQDVIKKAHSILQESQAEGRTPPPIYDFFIRGLINEKRCMCGNDLKIDQAGLGKLEELEKKVGGSQIAEIASEGKVILNKLIQKHSNEEVIEHLDNFRKNENHYAAAFREAKEKVTGLLAKLEDFDEKKIRKIAKGLNTIRDNKDKVWQELQLKRSQLDAKETEMEQTKKDLEKAEGDTESNKKWKKLHNLSGMAKTDLEQIHDEILNDIRETVRVTTDEIFRRIITRGAEIEKIDIDPKYNMRVIDKKGLDARSSLSAGQRLFLSLAFIAALRKVTDTNFPMIIDSPLGRIAAEERVEAAKALPEYLPETQMSFLITNTELDAIIEKDALTGKRIQSVREVWEDEKRIWRRYLLGVRQMSKNKEDVSTEVQIVK